MKEGQNPYNCFHHHTLFRSSTIKYRGTSCCDVVGHFDITTYITVGHFILNTLGNAETNSTVKLFWILLRTNSKGTPSSGWMIVQRVLLYKRFRLLENSPELRNQHRKQQTLRVENQHNLQSNGCCYILLGCTKWTCCIHFPSNYILVPTKSLNSKYLKYIIVWYDFQFHSTSRNCNKNRQ